MKYGSFSRNILLFLGGMQAAWAYWMKLFWADQVNHAVAIVTVF
jgi:hypothetical protein